jgi:predicted transcriptional regulator
VLIRSRSGGVTADEVAETAGENQIVVRQRLTELNRMGLIRRESRRVQGSQRVPVWSAVSEADLTAKALREAADASESGSATEDSSVQADDET